LANTRSQNIVAHMIDMTMSNKKIQETI